MLPLRWQTGIGHRTFFGLRIVVLHRSSYDTRLYSMLLCFLRVSIKPEGIPQQCFSEGTRIHAVCVREGVKILSV